MAARKPRPKRSEDLSRQKGVKEKLVKIYNAVEKGFQDQWTRTNSQLDYWDIYNCLLSEFQCYDGNAKLYIPIVHDAINARKTRFTNQIFPASGRYVEAVSANGDIPHPIIALCEHYVRTAKLRTEIMPALMKNGDIEGQYNVYVSWRDNTRTTTMRVEKPPKSDGMEQPGLEPVKSVEDEEIYDAGPEFEVVPDSDTLVLPATVNSIQEAMAVGGTVTIIRRWTKDRIQRAIDDGDIREDEGDRLIDSMEQIAKDPTKNQKKENLDAAGIHGDGGQAQIYETWCKLKVDGEKEKRICRAFFAGDDVILGCKLNPYWCDKVPLISCPVEKVAGVFKGVSKVDAVASLQYFANDILNEGADSATYALLPIIMTDPEKNPRTATMLLDLAAVWETNPQSTQFAQFPPLYQHAFTIVEAVKNQINQTLGVNPSMVPQSTGGKQKRNQAEIASEQMVDILTTADAVTVAEEGILTPMVEWMLWLDHQFRDKEITVKAFGRLGLEAQMERIEPIQMQNAYWFKWFGVEAARSSQQMQQQIAYINVLRGIPPQMYPGRTLDLTPILEQGTENVFGPRLAPLIFKSLRQQLTIPPDTENQMMTDGFTLHVNPLDDDIEHLKKHVPAIKEGDEHGTKRVHIQEHQQQMQKKMAAMVQGAAAGNQGSPGGAGPGVAGTPRSGASPQAPTGVQNPPGAVRPDNMSGAGGVPMPRKM